MRSIEPPGNPSPRHRPLTGGEIIVVVIVMILAAALTAAGLPAFGIVELLVGTAACVLHLLRSGGNSFSTPASQE
ncbi:hypothetical protein [Streptomyces cinereoruber]|uniref:hypothetical protein n=1 Tax=Streptomyces cinereoruber TaxID=67260 RepID=UPI003643295B